MKNKFNIYTKTLLVALVLFCTNYVFAGPGAPTDIPENPINMYWLYLVAAALFILFAFRKKIAKQSI